MPVPLWQPDPGRYGFYAKRILSGADLPYNIDYLLGHLIATVADITGFSVDWVMLLLPIFIAPLIVIPIIMMATSLRISTLGFLASLIAVGDKFFYSRSYIGYMDTDGVNLLLVLLSMAFIMLSLNRSRLLYALFGALSMILFGIWYHSAPSILLAITLSTLLYALVADKKDSINLQIFLIVAISIVPTTLIYKLLLLVATTLFLYISNKTAKLSYKTYLILISILLVTALFFVDPNIYIARAMDYMSTPQNLNFTVNGVNYTYPNDLLAVSEASGTYIWNSSGPTTTYTIYIFLGTLSYLLMLIRYKSMIITLPLILLGYASSFAGPRFDMYAATPLAFGVVYLLYMTRYTLAQRYKSQYIDKSIYYTTVVILVMMIWNVFYINKAYIMTLDFYANDKQALEKFGKETSDNDTIINSWDYGWPIWYYTSHDYTVSDNGYHGGPDTILISEIFMSDDQNFSAKASIVLAQGRVKAKGAKYILPTLLKDQNYTELISSIEKSNIKDYKYDGDVYIFFHKRMMEYYYTILSTAALDMHGNTKDKHEFFKVTSLVKPFSKTYSLVEGFNYILDSSNGMVTDADGNMTALNSIMITDKFKKKYKYTFHPKADRYMFTYERSLYWLDKKYYNSFYVQVMMFDNYDRDLFEKVAETNRFKILKIKR